MVEKKKPTNFKDAEEARRHSLVQSENDLHLVTPLQTHEYTTRGNVVHVGEDFNRLGSNEWRVKLPPSFFETIRLYPQTGATPIGYDFDTNITLNQRKETIQRFLTAITNNIKKHMIENSQKAGFPTPRELSEGLLLNYINKRDGTDYSLGLTPKPGRSNKTKS